MLFKRTLLGGTFLGASQFVSVILQALAIPHLTHAFGPYGWGLLTLVLLATNYASWICNWGFYLEGTQRVAASRNCNVSLANILREGLAAQFILFVVVAILGVIALSLVDSLHQYYNIYFSAIGLVFSSAISPLWFVNGLERFGTYAVINILPRAFSLPLMFVFVKTFGDFAVYLRILSLCSIATSMLLLWILRPFILGNVQSRAKAVPWMPIGNTLTNGFASFSSAIIASVSSGSVFWILPLFLPISSLGYFALADKIRGYQVTITQPITAALFPRMCALAEGGNLRDFMYLLAKPFIIITTMVFFISAFSYAFAPNIIILISSPEFLLSTLRPLRILCMVPLFTVILAFLTHQVLIPFGRHRQYLNICIIQSALLPIFLFILVPYFSLPGASVSLLLTEIITSVYAGICVYRLFRLPLAA